MILAGFSSIHKSYPSMSVLEGASGVVKTGEKIALLGANGTGKTTLLEILAGKIKRDSGTLEIPNSITRGYLPQEVRVSDTGNLFRYAVGGLDDLVGMRNRLREIHGALSEGLLSRRRDFFSLTSLAQHLGPEAGVQRGRVQWVEQQLEGVM